LKVNDLVLSPDKVTFWRSAALEDWAESGYLFPDRHDDVHKKTVVKDFISGF